MIALADWARAFAQMTGADKDVTFDVLAMSYDTSSEGLVIA